MKKIFYAASLVLVMSTLAIFGQDENEKPNPPAEAKEDKPTIQEGKTHQFGLTIKRMNYTYIPIEYNQSKLPNYFIGPLSSIGPLKKNEQVTLPFAFSYYNKNWNLFIEASHYKVTYNDMYYRKAEIYSQNYYYQQPGRIRIYDNSLPSNTRRESKVNFYKQKQFGESNSIFYGFGIRNIYKESYYKSSQRFGFYDYGYRNSANAFGLQLFLKYQYQISSSFQLNITFEPFLTYGVWKSSSHLNNNYFLNGSRNSIYGVDTDLQIAYSLNENLNLLIGYNYIYTLVQGKAFQASSYIPAYTTIVEPDHIYGYYLGLNAKF